jgi:hypothetical protein
LSLKRCWSPPPPPGVSSYITKIAQIHHGMIKIQSFGSEAVMCLMIEVETIFVLELKDLDLSLLPMKFKEVLYNFS